MNSDEFYTFEDRVYANPTLSSGEQEKFISNFRDVQNQNNAQIAQQTQSLGSNVPSNLGGLGGGDAYFSSRYQTPQVNEMVDTLKSAAKAQELNDLMANYKSQLDNRYKQAYREYQKAQRNYNLRHNNSGGNGGNGGGGDDEIPPYDTEKSDTERLGVGDNGVTTSNSRISSKDQMSETLNNMNGNTGSGTLPVTSSSGGYYTLNGKNYAFRTYNGGGLESGLGSYTKEGARNLLNNVVKQGGTVYDSRGNKINDLSLYYLQNKWY